MKYLITDIEPLTEQQREKCAYELNARGTDKIKNAQARLQSEAGICALKTLLEQNGINARIDYEPNGRPVCKNTDIYVSISHSGSKVICAYSNKKIGVDIEKIRDFNKKLLTALFDGEREKIGCDEDFFVCWCLKESIAKLSGKSVLSVDGTVEISRNTLIKTQDGYIAVIAEEI